jgi:hypothetical protein
VLESVERERGTAFRADRSGREAKRREVFFNIIFAANDRFLSKFLSEYDTIDL